MKILFFGDIFGKPGRKAVGTFLSSVKRNIDYDLCIANCENAADGRGITEKSAQELFAAGVDLFSSGNHLWDRKEGLEFITNDTRIAKPLNYPKASPGNEYIIKNINSTRFMLVSLCGQAFMTAVDSPFFALERLLDNLPDKPKCVLIDFHAESTAEKRTLAHYFDGKVSAILGTHTHIQTADEEILPNGTAYITDVGMCGSHDSVIGIRKEIAIEKIKTGLPVRHITADSGIQINAVLIELDDNTGKAVYIKRIREKL
ncbi:MAG: TIGR00282 family metallophosphoesterase [Candidatus Cloacimonetes bacterium]|jgi:hypothetical protein|nr:TIGR00282 family metallophosphoesterase [Candidatus Cloacimonadota bacterium]MDD4156037.1 TIGR00282 family metallophosphoesterase [Candidatus Cloacimonadota bacterium]